MAPLKKEHLKESITTTGCPREGVANYLSVDINGKVKADAAWYYPDPKAAAENIRDYVAFWRGVRASA